MQSKSEPSVDLPPEGSHNGIAAVLKTAGFAPVGVRIPRPPLFFPIRMNHVIRLAIFSAATLLVLSACSTDPVTPNDTSVYVVATKGTYFINDNVVITIDAGGTKADVPAPQDSTYVNGTKSVNGKTAVESFVFIGGVATDTTYVAQEGLKVSALTPLQFVVLGAPVDLGNKWVLTYDANATTWTALDDTIPSISIQAGPSTYTGSAKLLFTGKKLAAENITVNGSALSAVKTEMKMLITLYVDFGGFVLPVPIELIRNTWFAKGVGVVKIEQDAKVINAPPAPPLTLPGQRISTVRFNIAK